MTKGTTLVLGGARSGKSRRAQVLAESLGGRRTIVVTAEAFDDEMRERIARHRADRDASWRTVEAPLALPDVLAEIAAATGETKARAPDVVLVDCLTLWLSNLVLGEHDVDAASGRLLDALANFRVPLVLVSNEVGFGLVPETPLGRRFRDAQGRLNQRVAGACERVELVVAGQVLVIRDGSTSGAASAAASSAASGSSPDDASGDSSEASSKFPRNTAVPTPASIPALPPSPAPAPDRIPHAAAEPRPKEGGIRVIGVDFTSTPSRRKPLTAVTCTLADGTLHVDALETFDDLAGFEALLARPGPWIAGCDFPFGQSRRLVENIGWPLDWAGYVDRVAALSRAELRAALDAYRAPRESGDREHRRATDAAAGAISPQKLYGIPVALMFHEGAPRLRASGVTVPGLQAGDPDRIVVEAYPGVLARRLIGRRSYKNDVRAKQDDDQHEARAAVLDALAGGAVRETHGLVVELPSDPSAGSSVAPLAEVFTADPMADRLDALLCAVQAGWAWGARAERFGEPPGTDPLEGWIAEPMLDPGS